jgi:hypothetical protein
MDFRGHIIRSDEAARALIRHPGKLWREGFGLATPEEELAAVIHHAEQDYPPNGKSLAIHPPNAKKTPLYLDLMHIARGMPQIDIQTDGARQTYLGKEGHVREAMRLTNRRKPDLRADIEQHRRVGELLGYKPEAIEEFIRRIRSKLE